VASVTTFDRDGVPKSYVPYDPNDPRSIANANAQVRGLLNTPLPHTRDEMLSALTKGGYIVYDPTRDVTHTIPLARPDAVPGGPDAPCRYCGLGRSEHHEVTDRDERFGLYTTRLVGGDGAPAGVPIHPYEP
jgi:hypothetical protein